MRIFTYDNVIARSQKEERTVFRLHTLKIPCGYQLVARWAERSHFRWLLNHLEIRTSRTYSYI